MDRVEELRQAGLARVRAGEPEEAIALYDQAIVLATDDEVRELLTINKADALISIEQSGPEVQQLASILMRRRNLHHAFLAAYALMFKHRLASELKRAIFYGQLALDVANEANQALWKVGALNDLGNVYEMDSQFEHAIACFDEALTLIGHVPNEDERVLSRRAIVENLGYCKILIGETKTGIFLLESIIDEIEIPARLCDASLDLCYGYLDLEDYDKARHYAEMGLEHAVETRQIRNAHYLLGEVAYKRGDSERADYHFEQLAKFYPQFRNLKSLLFAIDLRGMVNLNL